MTRLALVPLLIGALALAAGTVRADPEEDPKGGDPKSKEAGAKPKGAVYSNAQLGIEMEGPPGWRLHADKGSAVSNWVRLATYFLPPDSGKYNPSTDADVVVSVRRRTAANLDDLMARVKKEFSENKQLTVTAMRRLEGTALDPEPSVVVDATYIYSPKRSKGPPAPPVSYRVNASYFLGAGREYLLYAKARTSHWSRLQRLISNLRSSVRLTNRAAKGPEGVNAYRNEAWGFACRFPKAYTVITPARGHHLVQFEGIAAGEPNIGVYKYKWSDETDADADRVAKYYDENYGATSETSDVDVAGKTGTQLVVRGTINGEDQTIIFAIFKRGSSELYRIRVAVPTSSEGSGMKAFKQFVGSFKLISRSS